MTTQVLAPPPRETRRADPASASAVLRRRPVLSPARPRPALSLRGGPLAASILLHAAAVGGILLLLRLGPSRPEVDRVATAETAESVEYVDLTWPVGVPSDGAGIESSPTSAPVSATDPNAPRRQTDAAPLVFPGRVPTGIPNAGSGAVGDGSAGGAAGPGAGGVGERLRPGFRDSRLYVTPGELPGPVKTNQQKYMEHLTARIEASNDSVAAGARTPNTDWTVSDASGRKWGLSEKGLHLGPVTIPNALIPKPTATGSNQKREEARTEQQQRDEIRRQEEERARREAREESIRAARERANAERESRAGTTN